MDSKEPIQKSTSEKSGGKMGEKQWRLREQTNHRERREITGDGAMA